MKRFTLLVIASLLVTFSIASAQWWGWNKDLYNWSTEKAWDLAVILDGKSPVDWHYDGYPAHHFNNFAAYPIGPFTCLHWTNPNGPIPVGDMAHVGASGSTGNLEIIDMYWTNQFGDRLAKSVVWNATTRVRYEGGEAIICLVNKINLGAAGSDQPWAAARPINIVDLRFVVLDQRIPLEELNNANEALNAAMEPLLPEVALTPSEELQIPLPVQPAVGQYIVVRWDNMAQAVDGSDQTQARDWAEFEVAGVSATGLSEQGSPEALMLLNVSTFPAYSEIRYELPKAANVSVSIYSVNGERITSLVSEFTPAGEHSVRWNTDKVPSGVYICRVSADGIQATSKIVHVK